MQEFPLPWFSIPLTVVYQDVSTLDDGDWHAVQVPTFKEVIVCAMLGNFYTVFDAQIRVPDRDIGIGTGLQATFFWVESEDFGGVGGSERYEPFWGDAPSNDGIGPKNRQPVA
jgi:hypothetical protein